MPGFARFKTVVTPDTAGLFLAAAASGTAFFKLEGDRVCVNVDEIVRAAAEGRKEAPAADPVISCVADGGDVTVFYDKTPVAVVPLVPWLLGNLTSELIFAAESCQTWFIVFCIGYLCVHFVSPASFPLPSFIPFAGN